MDGNKFHNILSYISSLVFTSNGAYHPWTAMLSIGCRNPPVECSSLKDHTPEKVFWVRQMALLDGKMS